MISERDRITSARNPRIVRARSLTERKYRRRHAAFLVEGLKLIHDALDGDAPLAEAFVCEASLPDPVGVRLLARLRDAEVPCHAVAPHVLKSLSERDHPQGLVAVARIPARALSDIPRNGQPLVVACGLQDPGNLGAIVRTADCAGASGVLLVEPCVDLYDPKTVRGTMGSLFTLPVVSVREPGRLWAWLRAGGYRLVGTASHGSLDAFAADLRGPMAFVLGNEARGLPDEVLGELDAVVRLPMSVGADSLNVAVAAGVLLYEAWRQRGFEPLPRPVGESP